MKTKKGVKKVKTSKKVTKTSRKKTPLLKKISKTTKAGTCDSCIFFVANREDPKVGTCFQVRGEIKKGNPWLCGGKFFKKGEMKFNNEQGFN